MSIPVYGPEVYGEPVYSDALIDPEVYGESPLADDEAGPTSFTADAVIKRTQTGSFTANASITLAITATFTADAVKFKHHQSGAPFALVQSKSATGIGPAGLAFDTTPTAGNLLVLGWVDRNGVDNSSHVAAGFIDGGEGLKGTFASARIYYKKAAGNESGELYTNVSSKTIAWIAEFSGVDADTAPQHQYFLHNGSGDRVNATHTFTVSDAALLVGLHYGDSTAFAPITNSIELFDRNINGVETPQVAASYRATTAGGTFTAGETHQAGADALASFGLAFLLSVGDLTALTAAAWIGSPVTGSFTANATLRRTQTGSLTADAAKRKTLSGTFTADATRLRTQTGAFTADARVFVSGFNSFTADAVLRRTQAGSLTADATRRSTSTTSFTANATKRKTLSSSFTADARTGNPLIRIFQDTFTRTVAKGLGLPWTWNPYDQFSDDPEDVRSYVDGSAVVEPAGDWYESWQGFPWATTGDVYFDFFVPSSWSTPNFRPTTGLLIDQDSYTGFYVEADVGGVDWHAYQLDGASFTFTPTPSTWYRLHGSWDGSTVNMNVWPVAGAEPVGWQYTQPQEFPAYDPASSEAPFLDLYYFPRGGSDGGVDNVEIWTSESTWVGFGGFLAAAVIDDGVRNGSFTANAVIRKTQSNLLPRSDWPTLISTATGTKAWSAGSSLTINTPTGTADGDVMVAFIVGDPQVTPRVITPPTGWTQIAQIQADPFVGDANYNTMFAKIASSEGGTQVFSWADSHVGGMVGGIVTFRNAYFPPTQDDRVVNARSGSHVTSTLDVEAYSIVGAAYAGGESTMQTWTQDAALAELWDIWTQYVAGSAAWANGPTSAGTVGPFTAAYTGSFSTISYIWSLPPSHNAGILADAVLQRTFAANATLKRTQTGSFTANAVVFAPSFTADALLAKANVRTVAMRAMLRKSLAGSFTSDAVKTTESRTLGSLTADAWVFATGLATTFTANSSFVAVTQRDPGRGQGADGGNTGGGGGGGQGRDLDLFIRVDGVDVTDNVKYDQTKFVSSVSGRPGDFEMVIVDRDHIYDFVSNTDVTLDIGGRRVWAGYASVVTATFAFAVDDTTDPDDTTRWWVLSGPDVNVLFAKRIVYDKANPANGNLHKFDADTFDGTIIRYVVNHYTDLAGDGVTLDVNNVGTPVPDKKGPGGAVPGRSVGEFMYFVSQLSGGIGYIDPELVLHYEDDDTENAPFRLTDRPADRSNYAGVADFRMMSNGSTLVNDAQVWGAGQGKAVMTYHRTQDSPSINAHGRWQDGDIRYDMYKQPSVNRTANSYVFGSPQNLRGHKDDQPIYRMRVYRDGLTAGMKVRVESEVFGVDEIIPIRMMTVTFPTPYDPVFDLECSHELDAIWSISEYPPLPKIPPYDGGHIPDPGGGPWYPPVVTPGGCECGITDDFGRTQAVGWGTASSFRPWTSTAFANTVISVGDEGGYMKSGPGGANPDCSSVLDFTDFFDGNINMTMRFRYVAAAGPILKLVWTADGPGYSDLYLDPDANTALLEVGGGPADVSGPCPLVVGDNGWMNLRWEAVFGEYQRVKFWADADAEPDTWTLQQTTIGQSELGPGLGQFQIYIDSPASPAVATELWVSALDINDINRCLGSIDDTFDRTLAGVWGSPGAPKSVTLYGDTVPTNTWMSPHEYSGSPTPPSGSLDVAAGMGHINYDTVGDSNDWAQGILGDLPFTYPLEVLWTGISITAPTMPDWYWQTYIMSLWGVNYVGFEQWIAISVSALDLDAGPPVIYVNDYEGNLDAAPEYAVITDWSDGTPMNLRVRLDEAGIHVNIWATADAEPAGWVLENGYSGGSSMASWTQLRGVSIESDVATSSPPFDPLGQLYVDAVQVVEGQDLPCYVVPCAQFEDFDREVTGGWGTSTNGAAWSTVSGSGTKGVTGGSAFMTGGVANAFLAGVGAFFQGDFEMTSRFQTGHDDFIVGFNWYIFDIALSEYFGLAIVTSDLNGYIFLDDNVDFLQEQTDLRTSTGWDWVPGSWYLVKWNVTGSVVKAKVWKEGDAEPDWQVTGSVPVIVRDSFYLQLPAKSLADNPSPEVTTSRIDYIDFDTGGCGPVLPGPGGTVSTPPGPNSYGCEVATRVDAFTYSTSYGITNGTSQVTVNGLTFVSGIDYTTSGYTITFTNPQAADAVVYVCYRGV